MGHSWMYLAFLTKGLAHELKIWYNTPTAWSQSRHNSIVHLNFINFVFSFPTCFFPVDRFAAFALVTYTRFLGTQKNLDEVCVRPWVLFRWIACIIHTWMHTVHSEGARLTPMEWICLSRMRMHTSCSLFINWINVTWSNAKLGKLPGWYWNGGFEWQ